MNVDANGSIYSVALRATGRLADVQRAAIASLPGRFRLAAGAADVVVLNPTPGTWPSDLERALDQGAQAVLVAGRALAATGAARASLERAAAARIPVLLDTPYAGAVSWRSVSATVAADVDPEGVVDSVVTWPADDPDQAGARGRALLDQLAVIRPLLGDSAAWLRLVNSSAGGYELVADDGPVATLTGVRAPVLTRLDVDVVTSRQHWRIRFDSGAPARPVVIERMDSDGIASRPLRYEGAARATWARLHDQLTGQEPIQVEEVFLGDLELATSLFPLR